MMKIDKEVWQIWTWRRLLKERKAQVEDLQGQLAKALPAQEELLGLKELYGRTYAQLQLTAGQLEIASAKLNQTETDLLRCRLDGQIVGAELEKTKIALEHARLNAKTVEAEHQATKGGLIKVLEWIHATHRLAAPAQGIRAILAKANRLSVFLLLLFPMFLLAAPMPILRNSWSTNTAGTPVQGLNNLSVTNLASGTNWLFYGILPQTVARLMDVSNVMANFQRNTFTTNLNTNFNTVDGSFTDIADTNEVMLHLESSAPNTFAFVNNASNGNATVILRNTNGGWRVTAQGVTNRLLFTQEGVNTRGGFIADPFSGLFFIGDTTSDVLFKEVSDGDLAIYRHDQNQYANLTASNILAAGQVSITNGGLVIQNFNATSNFVWTCTNAVTGEGEWRIAGGASYLFNANQFATNTAFNVDIKKAARLTNVVIVNQTNVGQIRMLGTSITWGGVFMNEDTPGSDTLDLFGNLQVRNLTAWEATALDLSISTNLDLPFSAVSVGQVWTLTNVALGRGSWSNAPALGETNFNGEISATNSTVQGWVYGKSNNTNLLRSFRGGNGILTTNESTNIVAAIDPAVVASQANLTAASNVLAAATATKQNGSAALTNIAGLSDTTFTNVPLGGTNISVRTAGGTNFIDTTGQLNNWAKLSTNAIGDTATNSAVALLTNKIDNQNGLGTNTTLTSATNNASVSNQVVLTISGRTGQNVDLVRFEEPQGTIVANVKSNGTLMLPDGNVSFPAIGWRSDDDGNGTGLYRPSANTVGFALNGFGNFRFSSGFLDIVEPASVSSGIFWSRTIGGAADLQLRTATQGVLEMEGTNQVQDKLFCPLTNRWIFYRTNSLLQFTPTNAEWLEVGFDSAMGWDFIRNQIGTSVGTDRPMVVGVRTNADILVGTNHSVTLGPPTTAVVPFISKYVGGTAIQVETNGSVTVPNSITNQSYVHMPTNTASFNTVAPAALHSVTLGKGWTNDLGARADLVLSVKLTDAVAADPALAFTNTTTGEAWTNTITFGAVASVQYTIVIPDIAPLDTGSFTDLSGVGSSVSILKAWWKLK